MQKLLEKGADPTIKNQQNKNAIEMAEKHEQALLAMIEQLRSSAVAPIFIINTPKERESIFDQAAAIFKENEHLIEEPGNKSSDE